MTSNRPNAADNLRERAEALLAKSSEAFQPEDLKNVNALAHELAVHQAELELQNEELCNTQLALQRTRDRYATLFEDAPVGYVVLDASGIIRQTNATWRAMLGRPDEDFRGTPFAETLLAEDAPIFLARFRAFFRNPAEKQIVVRIKRSEEAPFYAQLEARPRDTEPGSDEGDAQAQELMVIVSDVTGRKRAEAELKKIQWMLTDRPPSGRVGRPTGDSGVQGYGDLTALNRNGLILRFIDKGTLEDICAEFLHLLQTSSAIYEANGDYAYGIFSSDWCRLLDSASRQRCHTADNEAALASGRWLCHESCWTDCSKQAIESQAPVDIECHGGIHIYALPIVSAGEVIGAINFGYGDPPRDEARLRALAEAYELDPEELARRAAAYPSRPSYIIELAKQRLVSSARLIGIMVERRQAEEALRRSESLFQTMLALIPDMISIHDPDMNVIYSNWNGFASVPPARRILGEKCFRIYRGQDGVCDDCRARQVLTTKEPFAEEVELAEGRWVEVHVIPILGAEGECELFVEWVRDVTERKETEERLRQMEKMDAIGQLAGGVAHDFNNQLGGVMGYADLLLSRLKDPALKRYAENILVSSRRAADLTQKLLAFARKGQYQSVTVDIHAIVHEVVEILNHSIDKRIVIKQMLTANPSTTRGDPGQIQNALLNLAINASDAMQERGELVFETEVAHLDAAYCAGIPYDIAPGPYLRVSISDTGCGIPKENLDHVFEPFFTTKEVGKGTGMGLAAVYGTVKQHGGAINVYSEVGHGTTFRIYFAVEENVAHLARRDAEVTAAPRTATILVVDDEAIIRQLAEDMLLDLGYQVTTEENGESGVAYYEAHWQEIDLVILDMVMPKLNGPEAYRAMKDINPEVRVLLASGYSINGAAQTLLAEGVQGFLQKPFERTALSVEIAAALQAPP